MLLLIFTLVWQTDKSSLPKQTEIVWSLRDAKWCAQEAPRGLVKYLTAWELKWSHSDTNHLPGWPEEHISFSSPWQAPVYCTDTVAAIAAHTPQSYTGYSLFLCPHADLLGIADRWAHPAISDLLLVSHEDREGWERQGKSGLCLSPPKRFPFFSLLPVKKAPVGITLHFII